MSSREEKERAKEERETYPMLARWVPPPCQRSSSPAVSSPVATESDWMAAAATGADAAEREGSRAAMTRFQFGDREKTRRSPTPRRPASPASSRALGRCSVQAVAASTARGASTGRSVKLHWKQRPTLSFTDAPAHDASYARAVSFMSGQRHRANGAAATASTGPSPTTRPMPSPVKVSSSPTAAYPLGSPTPSAASSRSGRLTPSSLHRTGTPPSKPRQRPRGPLDRNGKGIAAVSARPSSSATTLFGKGGDGGGRQHGSQPPPSPYAMLTTSTNWLSVSDHIDLSEGLDWRQLDAEAGEPQRSSVESRNAKAEPQSPQQQQYLLKDSQEDHTAATDAGAAAPSTLTADDADMNIFVAVRVRPCTTAFLEAPIARLHPANSAPPTAQNSIAASPSSTPFAAPLSSLPPSPEVQSGGGGRRGLAVATPAREDSTIYQDVGIDSCTVLEDEAEVVPAPVRCVLANPDGSFIDCAVALPAGIPGTTSMLASSAGAALSASDAHGDVTRRHRTLRFFFDHILNESVTQADIMQRIGQRAVARVLQGYHGTIMCYGQSGSGKTHTMVGPRGGFLTRRVLERLVSSGAKGEEEEAHARDPTHRSARCGDGDDSDDDKDDALECQVEAVGLMPRMLVGLFRALEARHGRATTTGEACEMKAAEKAGTGSSNPSATVPVHDTPEVHTTLDAASSSWKVTISALELHNEELRDLLPSDIPFAKLAAGRGQHPRHRSRPTTQAAGPGAPSPSPTRDQHQASGGEKPSQQDGGEAAIEPPHAAHGATLGSVNIRAAADGDDDVLEVVAAKEAARGNSPSPRPDDRNGSPHLERREGEEEAVDGEGGMEGRTTSWSKIEVSGTPLKANGVAQRCAAASCPSSSSPDVSVPVAALPTRASAQSPSLVRSSRSAPMASVAAATAPRQGKRTPTAIAAAAAAGGRASSGGGSLPRGVHLRRSEDKWPSKAVAPAASTLLIRQGSARSSSSSFSKNASHSAAAPAAHHPRHSHHRPPPPGLRHEVFIEGLRRHPVRDVHEAMEAVRLALLRRQTASTALNACSSRSHTFFFVQVEQRERRSGKHSGRPVTKVSQSTLTLVDLAGSERVSHTGAAGARLKEAQNINLSLSTLGNVMRVLSSAATTATTDPHIPYRDSKLTRILQGSLGGNALTFLLCNVSPDPRDALETLSSLRFAKLSKAVKNHARRNTESTDAAGGTYTAASERRAIMAAVAMAETKIKQLVTEADTRQQRLRQLATYTWWLEGHLGYYACASPREREWWRRSCCLANSLDTAAPQTPLQYRLHSSCSPGGVHPSNSVEDGGADGGSRCASLVGRAAAAAGPSGEPDCVEMRALDDAAADLGKTQHHPLPHGDLTYANLWHLSPRPSTPAGALVNEDISANAAAPAATAYWHTAKARAFLSPSCSIAERRRELQRRIIAVAATTITAAAWPNRWALGTWPGAHGSSRYATPSSLSMAASATTRDVASATVGAATKEFPLVPLQPPSPPPPQQPSQSQNVDGSINAEKNCPRSDVEVAGEAEAVEGDRLPAAPTQIDEVFARADPNGGSRDVPSRHGNDTYAGCLSSPVKRGSPTAPGGSEAVSQATLQASLAAVVQTNVLLRLRLVELQRQMESQGTTLPPMGSPEDATTEAVAAPSMIPWPPHYTPASLDAAQEMFLARLGFVRIEGVTASASGSTPQPLCALRSDEANLQTQHSVDSAKRLVPQADMQPHRCREEENGEAPITVHGHHHRSGIQRWSATSAVGEGRWKDAVRAGALSPTTASSTSARERAFDNEENYGDNDESSTAASQVSYTSLSPAVPLVILDGIPPSARRGATHATGQTASCAAVDDDDDEDDQDVKMKDDESDASSLHHHSLSSQASLGAEADGAAGGHWARQLLDQLLATLSTARAFRQNEALLDLTDALAEEEAEEEEEEAAGMNV